MHVSLFRLACSSQVDIGGDRGVFNFVLSALIFGVRHAARCGLS
jgi:hypothetical protein